MSKGVGIFCQEFDFSFARVLGALICRRCPINALNNKYHEKEDNYEFKSI